MYQTMLSRLFVVLVGFLVVGCMSSEPDVVHLCYAFFGPINDLGYTYRHNNARTKVHSQLQKDYPNNLIISDYAEEAGFGNITEVLANFISSGCQLIFATSTTFAEATIQAARTHQNVSFALQAGYYSPEAREPNMILYAAKPYVGWYKAGVAAAMQSQACIAFLSSFNDHSEVILAVGGFSEGIRSVLGPAHRKVHLMGVNSWYNTIAETIVGRIFENVLECDVVAHYSDSFALVEYAKKNQMFSIAMHNDASLYYGDSVLTSIEEQWDGLYYQFVDDWLNKNYSLFGQSVYATEVTQMVSLSPQAKSGLVPAIDLPAFDTYCQTWANGQQTCYPDTAPPTQLHPEVIVHPSLNMSSCPAGYSMDFQLDAVTGKVARSCSPCPENHFLDQDTLACMSCVRNTQRAECVSLQVPTFVVVLIVVLPVAAIAMLGMYFWHLHRAGILRHQERQDIANFVFHEIRNPMHAVVNTLEAAPPEVQEWDLFPILEDSSGIIQRLLNRALDLLKLEGEKMTLECLPMDLHKTIRVAVDISRATKANADRSKKVSLVLAPDVPQYIRSDPLRLQQIIVNLVSNAIKFCRTEVSVRVSISNRSRVLVIHVEDDGIGMSKEVQKVLFQAFTQAKANIAREYGGTGLGLSITQKLVVLMKGSVHVDSTEGKGSNFQVHIPFVQTFRGEGSTGQLPIGTSENSLPSHHPHLDISSYDFSNITVLFADDNSINRSVGEAFLRSLGLKQYSLAKDGQELLQMCSEHHCLGEDVDCIFVDLSMPVKDGWEAIASIRALEVNGQRQKAHIIALSGSNSPQDVHRAIAVGANVFLPKPATKVQMTEAIMEMDSSRIPRKCSIARFESFHEVEPTSTGSVMAVTEGGNNRLSVNMATSSQSRVVDISTLPHCSSLPHRRIGDVEPKEIAFSRASTPNCSP